MTRRRDTRARLLASLLVFGCDSQVGEEYTGEPMLSLQGNVVLGANQQRSDLVPQLAFYHPDGESVVLLNGEVSGDFPARFRFDIMQAPPDEVIDTALLESMGMEGGIAHAKLVLLPADHPRHMPLHFDVRERECSSDYPGCTHLEVACEYPKADGTTPRCRERTMQCTEHQCALEDSWTTGSTPHPDTTGTSSSWRCDSGGCYQVASACDAAGACVSDVYHCEPVANAKVTSQGVGTMTTCTVLGESGDTSLLSYVDLDTVVRDYEVKYVTLDVADPHRGLLEQGYNLLVLRPIAVAEWLERMKCTITKTAEAVGPYNLEHGTYFSALDVEVLDLQMSARAECGFSDFETVVENPLDEVIELDLGPAYPDGF